MLISIYDSVHYFAVQCSRLRRSVNRQTTWHTIIARCWQFFRLNIL